MLELVNVNTVRQGAAIKVIGVGGGGGNAVEHMLKANIQGVDFICANTDAQALESLSVRKSLQLGQAITQGLGAGADPEIGRKSALEDRDQIMDVLTETDMVFITAGMGGGTGTGAAPIVAQVAKEMDILTVAVVTRPFDLERRAEVAQQGIDELSKSVDSLITVSNQKLLSTMDKEVSMLTAFGAANDVLLDAVRGIAQLITQPGLINVDFADVKTVMGEMGMAVMGSGKAQGEDRARIATEAAISSPLLDDVDLTGARAILANITAGKEFGLAEYAEIGDTIKGLASKNPEAKVIIGTAIDPDVTGEIRVTIVAAGLGQADSVHRPPLVPTDSEGNVDYGKLQQPAVIRQQGKVVNSDLVGEGQDTDIPAFLRRQVD